MAKSDGQMHLWYSPNKRLLHLWNVLPIISAFALYDSQSLKKISSKKNLILSEILTTHFKEKYGLSQIKDFCTGEMMSLSAFALYDLRGH